MSTKVVMEALSPTMEEGRLVEWKKQEGDAVAVGDVLAEVETDKAVMELVARAGGTLLKQVIPAGTTVPVSDLVAVIGEPGEDVGDVGTPPKKPAPKATKTEEQAAVYGGAAGSWYDPCYHQACDTFSTVLGTPPFPDASGLESAEDAELMRGNGAIGLGQLADGAAHATWTLARSKSPLVGPAEATVARAAKARTRARRAANKREFRGPIGIR